MVQSEIIHEVIYHQGDEYFNAFATAILNATQEIWIESYIWEHDVIGLHFLNLLTEASKRGVKIKLLLDGVGSSHWTYGDLIQWQNPNFEIRFFHAMPWQKSLRLFWQSVSFKKISLGASKFNRRNHRKIAIIDSKILLIGSMNISACHSKKFFGQKAWRDTSVKTLEETAILKEKQSCQEAWTYSWFAIPYNQKVKKLSRQKIIQNIKKTKNKIWITTPYLIPPTQLLKTILKAAKSGLDVKIIIPHRGDSRTIQFASEAYYQLLLVAGVELYEYQPTMIHAKVMILDDDVTIGSNNLDYRGLYYDLEASLNIKYPENRNVVVNQFLEDIKQCKKITPESWTKRPWLNRILEQVFLLFRRIL